MVKKKKKRKKIMAHTDIWADFKPGYKFVCKYMSYWTTLIIFTDYSLFKLGDIHTHTLELQHASML